VVPSEKINEFWSYFGIKCRLETAAYYGGNKICDGVDNHFSFWPSHRLGKRAFQLIAVLSVGTSRRQNAG
jgi:hypothetical protein